ncbi:hypothetical protein IG631_10450 [Alternaria alternata]|nr:hypothetical protein IG631_10450 [Alternaria alternata]
MSTTPSWESSGSLPVPRLFHLLKVMFVELTPIHQYDPVLNAPIPDRLARHSKCPVTSNTHCHVASRTRRGEDLRPPICQTEPVAASAVLTPPNTRDGCFLSDRKNCNGWILDQETVEL